MSLQTILVLLLVGLAATPVLASEKQLTSSPKNHDLDNTHNFSGDDRFLCYDTRGMVGPGIENCQSIEKVAVADGQETIIYQPKESIIGDLAAPGIGAPYFCPTENKVAFIHGPLVEEVESRGYYAKSNRRGAEVRADGSGDLTWLDRRDTATDRDTIPGAHRGGTHDHEYSLDGQRIGITYDDALMHEYDRTIGYLEKNPKAPEGASHYFALLVSVTPKGTSQPGEIEKAWGDNWVDREGRKRAFIGKVRSADGSGYDQSLFVVDIPEGVDITTADSGSATRFPSPPEGVQIRRLTDSYAEGIVRCHAETERIAYYGRAEDGTDQVFIIPADGAENHPDPSKRPIQATQFKNGVEGGIRWHPSGDAISCIADNGIALISVRPGKNFGKAVFVTPRSDEPERLNLVWSHDGNTLAYNKRVPTVDADGKQLKTFD
ncbi:MAG: DUF3748 domain-containing protein, partial [Candidatus Omnitrophica bacterium]|nr:DUF3748 domain-containing protein [Candidatus Omnitrophota bacterium]